jgi:dihydroorotate dehydrogenase
MGLWRLSLAAYRMARPLLFRFDPERIHRWTLRGLRGAGENRPGRAVLAIAAGGRGRPRGTIDVGGLTLRNRVGVAAGFDKNGVALRGWAALGLGFAEVGTVTPMAQPGNPRPRLFRLSRDEALINRMGFNNAGAAELARHVMLARPWLPAGFGVGVNIGRGKDTPDAAAISDFSATYRAVAPVADYVAVNVSSPNTPGLRAMQAGDTLAELLGELVAESRRLGVVRPLLVKLAPDLDDATLVSVARVACDAGAAGLILVNTTTKRTGLVSHDRDTREAGGLSGRPLLTRTMNLVARVRRELGAGPMLIASGGISSGQDAAAAIEAGADLVQLWTGLVYRGPGLIGEAIAATHRGSGENQGVTGGQRG